MSSSPRGEVSQDWDALEDFLARMPREPREPCRLYLVSPAFDLEAHAQALASALAAGGAAVAAYQLRLKGVADDEVLRAAHRLQPLCAAAGVAFIVNDRADLAAACGADGVHLGQEDGTVAEARRLLGPAAQVGVTCHGSRHLAMDAGEQGANYLSFGAFFPTSTKEVRHRADPRILRWWTAISPVPCVAIGGITPGNARLLVDAGADFLAVSGAVWGGPDPADAIRAFLPVLS